MTVSPAPTGPGAEPSAAETLYSTLGGLWTSLSALRPEEIALNLALSVLVLIVVALAVWLSRRGLDAGVTRLGRGDAPTSRRTPKVAAASRHLLTLGLGLCGLVVVLSIWGVDLLGWLADSGAGATLLRLALIIVVAVALIEISGQLVNRLLGAIGRNTDQERRTAQVRTLGPLIRGSIQGFVVIIAALMALSELRVDTGPLLASAGVLGVALGFGAQTLVKDLLTGFFLVVEDIVAIGDNIQIGDKSGTVEAMTLRTIRVRNMDGTLHILPHSEAQVISNRTKTFSAYVFNIGVGYEADIEHALAVMAKVAERLQADTAFGPAILAPLEIMGVDALGDSAVMLKARFRTRPGEQWRIGREYNKRIKQAFDAEGIDIPYPYRKLVFEGPERRSDDRVGQGVAMGPGVPDADLAQLPSR